MSLSIEFIVVAGCAAGTAMSVSALVLDLAQKNRHKTYTLANCREELPSASDIIKHADKDIEDLQHLIVQLENSLGDRVESKQIQKTKSLLDEVLHNLHRIPGRALE